MLAKLPALDKGYVAMLSSSNSGRQLADIKKLVFTNPATKVNLNDLSSLTLVFKCPLFVQLNLSVFNLRIINVDGDGLEAYIPNQGEVGATDAETSRLISNDITHTTEALLINPSAYVADGCDPFMSQVICPVSTYTTIVVHGSLTEWRRYIAQVRVPAPIQAYTLLVQQIVDAEWNQ